MKILDRYRPVVFPAAIGAVVILFLLFRVYSGGSASDVLLEEWDAAAVSNDASFSEEADSSQEIQAIYVDVKGEVAAPGVYLLEEGMRVLDAIEKAGGVTESGERDAVNLAQRVHDEMVIYVPGEGDELTGVTVTANQGNGDDSSLNVNTAGQAELETLPGIGPGKAGAILDYREEHGPFTELEQLMAVPGIGERTFEQLSPLIRLR
ncbi:hypothetical protein CR205_09075 [Alteribacter lacisalsi]|uniref:Helix-hairpin-helix DNA-binding motif class 1 domain-containing protein n=1 Tax=Alteribacter lacisalsi TaxID=2045244 RepID=A0A2W0HFJ6_9BACI|nr:helix-hairpin-helix domain-containing protein [Alteribacter lacisalsi]PYZ98710.1 hypothetical protein CR205_09075 [Alteribacter lacisalsi]